jgi:hypothetical protein
MLEEVSFSGRSCKIQIYKEHQAAPVALTTIATEKIEPGIFPLFRVLPK